MKNNTIKEGLVIKNLQGKLAELVVRKYHKEFKGTRAEFNGTIVEGEVLKYSNTIFNNFANVLLRQETGDTTHVLTGEDVIQYWDEIPDKCSTYADICGLVIFPNAGENEVHRQRVLGILDKKLIDKPLIVYGLQPVRCDDNEDGFQFEGSDYLEVKEAEYLQRDGNVRYDESLRNIVSDIKGDSSPLKIES